MRIIYDGRLSYARELLRDITHRKDEFNIFLDLVLDNLTIGYADFFGDVEIPLDFKLRGSDDSSIPSYLYPTIELSTPIGPRRGRVTILISRLEKGDANPENLAAICNTIVDTDEKHTPSIKRVYSIKDIFTKGNKYMTKIPEIKCRFRVLPYLNLQHFVITKGKDRLGLAGGYPKIDFTDRIVRIHDEYKESEGFEFAQIVSEALPSVAVLFFDEAKKRNRGWEIVSDGGWYTPWSERELEKVIEWMMRD